MEEYKIIVIGASSGGVEALLELFRELKPDFNAAIFVVLHIPPNSKSYLPDILNRHSPIPVEPAIDAEKITPGRAYIAPPNHHLVLQKGRMRLVFGPEENHTRPAIDPLFVSAAKAYGPRVIGVILTGNLSDGTKGQIRIQQAGGLVVVQDPEDALFPGMPLSVLQHSHVDYLLPISEIASLLNQLTEPVILGKGEKPVDEIPYDHSGEEIDLIKKDFENFEVGYENSQRSIITCPDCGGVLWEIQDGKLVRYRCHTGHVFDPDVLLAAIDSELEKAFWTSIRLLIEKAAAANRLALNARKNEDKALEEYYLSVAKEAENEAKRMRETWLAGKAKASEKISSGELANDDVTEAVE